MSRSVVIILLFSYGFNAVIGKIQIGKILDASMKLIGGTPSATIAGSCDDCLCELLNSSTYFSFNCFMKNGTCAMFNRIDENRSFTLTSETESRVYFLSLFTETIAAVSENDDLVLIWRFNRSLSDQSETYIGHSQSTSIFSSFGVTGDNASLVLSRDSRESVFVSHPFLELFNRSWTFEAWIYLKNLSQKDYGIVGQCSKSEQNQCLHLNIRHKKLYFGFYSNDILDQQSLETEKWYHVAFTFDCTTRKRSLYLNGIEDNTNVSSNCYSGIDGNLTFGTIFLKQQYYSIDGLIDEISFINRSKSAQEILNDATLIVHLSFDQESISDCGPLKLPTVQTGNISFTDGKIAGAVNIGYASESYILVKHLVLMSTEIQAYSFSVWIKPISSGPATIIHGSSNELGGTPWCTSILGLTHSSHLMAVSWARYLITVTGPKIPNDSWTHATVIYTSSKILKVYINGSFHNASQPFNDSFYAGAKYLFVGNSKKKHQCAGVNQTGGQYVGGIDDLRFYLRDLTDDEVKNLSAMGMN